MLRGISRTCLSARASGGLRVKRRNTGQHVVKRHAQRIEIAAMIDRMALGLLGTHVQRRSHRHARLREMNPVALLVAAQARNRRPSPVPFLVIKMFSGLTSRWTSPTSPAAPMA